METVNYGSSERKRQREGDRKLHQTAVTLTRSLLCECPSFAGLPLLSLPHASAKKFTQMEMNHMRHISGKSRYPLSVSISLSMYIYIYMYTYTCTFIYIYICTYMYIYTYTCIHVYLYIHTNVCMSERVACDPHLQGRKFSFY